MDSIDRAISFSLCEDYSSKYVLCEKDGGAHRFQMFALPQLRLLELNNRGDIGRIVDEMGRCI